MCVGHVVVGTDVSAGMQAGRHMAMTLYCNTLSECPPPLIEHLGWNRMAILPRLSILGCWIDGKLDATPFHSVSGLALPQAIATSGEREGEQRETINDY